MKILSCGAGMQSTALALMSCENKMKGIIHKEVPIYDAVIFCDLGFEPYWVTSQVEFIQKACADAGNPFYKIESNLYKDYLERFGIKHITTVPFWSVDENGKKAKMRRYCTLDYKIAIIEKFLRHNLLGYRKYQRLKPEDFQAHQMHIGFSYEERRRISEKELSKLYVKKYPLVDMKWERADSYRYILEVWGLDTKASACVFCPFHKNYFFRHLKENCKNDYEKLVEFDKILEERQPNTAIKSKIYISRSRKRIDELLPEECNDAECFDYNGKAAWNGF